MKWYFIIFLALYTSPLFSQTTPLSLLEIILVGPKNTDRHHPAQKEYYQEYYQVLIAEIDLWLEELESHQKSIKRNNKRRIKRKKPIKNKDIPKWNANVKLIKGLRADRLLIEEYLEKWNELSEVDNTKLLQFQTIYNGDGCYDLITPNLVLSPKEYTILPYYPKEDLFEWREFFPETVFSYNKLIKPESTKIVRRKLRNCNAPNPEDCYRKVKVLVPAEYLTINCPKGYDWNGKSCYKSLETPTDLPIDASIIIMYSVKNLPVTLDGWRKIRCR